jgi:peptide/nickel transport system substrate-binding protein
MKKLLTASGLLAVMLGLVTAVGACNLGTSGTVAPPTPTAEGTPAAESVTATLEGAVPGGQVDVFAFEKVPTGGKSTVVIGEVLEPDTLYLYGGSALASADVLGAVYDGPIEGLDYDYQPVILEALPRLGGPEPGAALQTVSVAPGQRYVDAQTQEVVTATRVVQGLQQLTVQFRFRPGITWQDGTPVTAEDSVFSARLACDPATGTSKTLCERTDHYVKINDSTVEWRGLPGYLDQTYYTNFYTPLPRQQLGAQGQRMDQMTASEVAADGEFARRPYAYGPFQVSEWVPGDHIELVRNEHYWRRSEGLPVLDDVVFRFYADSDSLLAALLGGQVDVAGQDGLEITQYADMEAARAAGKLATFYVPGTSWEHVDFELLPGDDRVPLGACKEVRQAIARGTDRQAMVDQIMQGKTSVANSFVPATHWAYPASGLAIYAYDPAAARQALEQLGFTDANGDGTREAGRDISCTVNGLDGKPVQRLIPAGTKLSLVLATTQGSSVREQASQMFAKNMADIGVAVTLDYVERDVLFDSTPEGPLTGRRYDLAEFAWLTGVQPPVALYYCEDIPAEANGWVGQNTTGWCSPNFDLAARKAEGTLDRGQSLPFYKEAQALWTDDLPSLPLFGRLKVLATRPDLWNFAPNATVNSETWNIETWGIAPKP